MLPKEETIINVELTVLQKKYYRAIYERNLSVLQKGGKSTNMPSLQNIMMELRKCCNHPFLLKGVEDHIHDEDASHDDRIASLINSSGKMVLLDKLFPKLRAGGHKVLIFSQMVRMLDILEDYLVERGYTYERLDGSKRGLDRQAAIDRFCDSSADRFVFLASTRAGGQGINLTAADTVVIFDSDWFGPSFIFLPLRNPQNDVQAQARCHRIGQTQAVKVYRLVTRNTYEAEMFDRASKKLGLDRAVLSKIDAGSIQSGRGEAAKQIDKWLRHGAYALFSEDGDEASRNFCDEDIDRILENRARTVVEAVVEGQSEFSKASFVADKAGF